jgi:hypothetical protein
MCLPHDFIDQLFISIITAPLLLPLYVADQSVGALKRFVIFGAMRTGNLAKNVALNTVNIVAVKPAYFVSYPFRKIMAKKK